MARDPEVRMYAACYYALTKGNQGSVTLIEGKDQIVTVTKDEMLAFLDGKLHEANKRELSSPTTTP